MSKALTKTFQPPAALENFDDAQFELVHNEAKACAVQLGTIFRDGIRDYGKIRQRLDAIDSLSTMAVAKAREAIVGIYDTQVADAKTAAQALSLAQKAADLTATVATLQRSVMVETPERYLRMLGAFKAREEQQATNNIKADTVIINGRPVDADDDFDAFKKSVAGNNSPRVVDVEADTGS